jgi:glucan phosphoethanolaminetransferase (alkaline phosphatase superfamily)
MSWEIIGLICVGVLVLLAILFRKTPFVKKYWKYLLIIAPVAFILILKIIQDTKNKKKEDNNQTSAEATKEYIQEIKEQITEVQTVAKVEAVIAKTKNDEKMQELKEVQAIDDGRERRKRLAEMIG